MLAKFEHDPAPRADVVRLAMSKLEADRFEPASLALKRARFLGALTRAVEAAAVPQVRREALEEYRKALALAAGQPAKYARVHMRLVSFELQQLDRDPKSTEAPLLAQDATEHILAAVSLGLPDARVLLARLPGLAAQFPATAGVTMAQKVGTVPAWTLLPWVPQLIGALSGAGRPAAAAALAHIAETHLVALLFPLFSTPQTADEAVALRQRAQRAYPRMVEFAQALEVVRTTDNYSALAKLDTNRVSADSLGRVADKIFPLEKNELRGPIHREFEAAFKPLIQQVLASKSADATARFIEHVRQWLQARRQVKDEPLRQYSPWFEAYATGPPDLPMPQSYQLDRPPEPMPPRIVMFGSKVLVMPSLRKPIRITMLGTDGREVRYLVKSGEDCRVDARVQQLFSLMNALFARHAACAAAQMRVRTYAVVPVAPLQALVEWVPDTTTLKSLITTELRRRVASGRKTLPRMREVLANRQVADRELTAGELVDAGAMAFLNRILARNDAYRKDSTARDIQKLLASTNTVEMAAATRHGTEALAEVQALFDADLLREGALGYAASPEARLLLRQRFVVSMATLTVAGYVLGLGDRHLDNYLLDTTVGELVPIDFGAAFSHGQFLGVAEVVPVRLTRQIVHVCEPLGIALLSLYMERAMAALREKSELLMAAMSVFVTDPMLDWPVAVEPRTPGRPRRAAFLPADGPAHRVRPGRRLEFAHKRLLGLPSGAVMLEELSFNRTLKEHPPTAQTLQRLVGVYARTADGLEGPLSPAAQVQLLVQHATDPALLARMFPGWAPWL